MVQNEITFENLPKAVAHLVSEVAEIKNLVYKGQTPAVHPKRIPIGIDDACKLIGKAKPTVYTLVRKRLLPCYKNGKHLYFFEIPRINADDKIPIFLTNSTRNFQFFLHKI